ncbi:MAG: dihydroorotate dehydrogenase-like protein [Chloroflexi bacterium]|nr:dihydroorotate dehydrogenase-like protein [Chloroflexota bacterium]MBI3733914.1 dihydroorotate dehydrogenase-like protein [Chloroflexota bacterium]
MVNLSTTYLGLELKNPVVPSSSPLMQKVVNLKRLEDAGAPAVVLHSLFEEQLLHDHAALDYYLAYGAESFAEARTYFPNLNKYNLGPDGYLEHIRKAKSAVGIPVIASLNGFSTGGWIEYARQIEQAGADALELNVYYIAADPALSSEEVEQMYLDLVRDVKTEVTLPVAVKLGHYFTSFANMARRLDHAGADALVLFNRFYQPDFDLEHLEIVPNLNLSNPYELRLRLRWVALLYGRLRADLAVTGGVHSAEDVVKGMMAGASVAMMTSALLEAGIDHLRVVLADLTRWVEEHEYHSIQQMRGSMSQRAVSQPAAFERANYMRVLRAFEQPVSREIAKR